MEMTTSTFPDIRWNQPSDVASQAELSKDAVRGGAYLAARYGLGVLVSLGNMLVMTWWLGPHIYGLFVTAISLVAFLATISRAGVDTFLVRRESPPDRATYDTAHAIILIASFNIAG